MRYTAQEHLDAEDLAAAISEVRDWLERHQLDPRTQYRVGAKAVRLRIDFTTLPDAAAFCPSLRRTGARDQRSHAGRGLSLASLISTRLDGAAGGG